MVKRCLDFQAALALTAHASMLLASLQVRVRRCIICPALLSSNGGICSTVQRRLNTAPLGRGLVIILVPSCHHATASNLLLLLLCMAVLPVGHASRRSRGLVVALAACNTRRLGTVVHLHLLHLLLLQLLCMQQVLQVLLLVLFLTAKGVSPIHVPHL